MYIALNTTIPCYSEIHVYAQCVDLDLQTIICLCFKMGFKRKRLKMMFLTRIVRGSDYSPASELFARERQTMTGNNAKLDLVNVDAHKKIGQILTICS